MLSELNYHKAKEPSELVMLWTRQNDVVIREADQKAFDKLPAIIRAIVNDAPIQLFCPALLLGCKRYGANMMANALKEQLSAWMEREP